MSSHINEAGPSHDHDQERLDAFNSIVHRLCTPPPPSDTFHTRCGVSISMRDKPEDCSPDDWWQAIYDMVGEGLYRRSEEYIDLLASANIAREKEIAATVTSNNPALKPTVAERVRSKELAKEFGLTGEQKKKLRLILNFLIENPEDQDQHHEIEKARRKMFQHPDQLIDPEDFLVLKYRLEYFRLLPENNHGESANKSKEHLFWKELEKATKRLRRILEANAKDSDNAGEFEAQRMLTEMTLDPPPGTSEKSQQRQSEDSEFEEGPIEEYPESPIEETQKSPVEETQKSTTEESHDRSAAKEKSKEGPTVSESTSSATVGTASRGLSADEIKSPATNEHSHWQKTLDTMAQETAWLKGVLANQRSRSSSRFCCPIQAPRDPTPESRKQYDDFLKSLQDKDHMAKVKKELDARAKKVYASGSSSNKPPPPSAS
ncbi:hypothetical protein BJ508DRAFT_323592 [Ascobolus immersus RN42]|uniref:Uncharacterized protein n=1 Tax=Ascobolus immersus RN42 TaxID=1160509 RepID=A0A3N4IHY8_ASCIM|nr:hypothetical protein BJ508DRAFT_323592 [Ascobolus immersus RN42]